MSVRAKPALFCLLLFFPLFLGAGESLGASASPDQLSKKIFSLLSSPLLKGAKTALEVCSADSGRVIFSYNPGLLLMPGSNLKIITSAAALHYLGNDYRFKTELRSDKPASQGLVKGDLYPKGYGDPFLVNEEMWLFSNRIYGKGLRGVEGDLVVDASYFDGRRFGRGWGTDLKPFWYNAEIRALSFNFNTVGFWTAPGKRPGDPVKFWTDPPSTSFIETINKATTTARRRGTVTVTRKKGKDIDTFVIAGKRPLEGKPKVVYRSVREGDLFAGASLADFLKRKGVSFKGKIRRGKAPAKAVLLAVHRSRPLREIIAGLNKYSNNFMAEMILKTLGAEKSSPPGTAVKGIEQVEKFLRHIGEDPAELKMVDGSGLSRENRVNVRLLCRVLFYLYRNFEQGPEFISSLAWFAQEGTLKDRAYRLKGKIRAKSGHIKGVAALSGYLKSKKTVYIFSMITNGRKISAGPINDLQDRLCLLLLNEL